MPHETQAPTAPDSIPALIILTLQTVQAQYKDDIARAEFATGRAQYTAESEQHVERLRQRIGHYALAIAWVQEHMETDHAA